jgi:putative tryptophan/tyrosine transport system substrate-binding protein
MKRREFITLLGAAATAWPLAAGAQQPAMPVIGWLSGVSSDSPQTQRNLDDFRRGLGQAGYVEGRNVRVEYRWALGQYDRLPALAQDLVHRPVSVIVTSGGIAAVQAAKAATTVIPVVFQTGVDPVQFGLVSSFNRPGGNVTGITQLASQLSAKRLDLLHKLVPTATSVAMLVNPDNAGAEPDADDAQAAARTIGLQIHVFKARSDGDIERAFTSIVEERFGALLVAADPFLTSRRDRLAALAARHAVPAIYILRAFAEAGGLISYGTVVDDLYRDVGLYVARILKGEKPADLPVVQVAKFELVINLKTARTLGITISDNLLSLADEVIE